MTDAERNLWSQDGSAQPPRDRLREVMAALVRARRLQLLADYAFVGLVVGLVLATVVVLLSRLAGLPYAPFELTVGALILVIVITLLLGWRRRPDTLDVAIRADLALRLKQRLSTAWEYTLRHDDVALADRLAAQAVKARLPARARLVFPLRMNLWGRLAPVAATALLLVSVLDLSRIQMPAPRTVDERVVDEGQRLSALGREMQARAARDKLPMSAKHAAELERLGARMESGALSRRESLGMLRQLAEALDREGRQMLAGANRKIIDSARPDAEARSLAPGQGELAERMVGDAARSDSRALSKYLNDLARSGAQRRDLNALEKGLPPADKEELRAMLENMAQIEQARKEQEEMQSALAQLRQAQENLGDSAAGMIAGRGLPIDDDEGNDQEGDSTSSANSDRRRLGESRGASRFGSQSDSSIAAERQHVPILADAAKSGPILKPQGDIREGESLVTQGQVLPRANRPNVENVQMKAEFASQVEEVLSKEQYSAQSKEFIRRYFLNLSQGVLQQQPRGGQ